MQYEVVIGLEVHVQVRTESKMFCTCPNAFGASPNTLICPVCMGYPGALPYPNATAVHKAVKAGLICKCEINRFSRFDRKSYFYPDMAKNYQITQFDLPFCLHGEVPISGRGFSGEMLTPRAVKLTRIHLEEEAAKSTHFGTASGIDYNRAGVPLLEIVSEPDLHSADEAYAYLLSLKRMMQFGDIGDCDMEKGQMRCDVNLSLRPVGQTEYGTKVELKNLNSTRAVHRAIQHEIMRQYAVLFAGGHLVQETRGWNDDAGDSYTMRTKEDAHDYRYFPDPDLPPVILREEEIEAIRAELPEMPREKCERYIRELNLTEYDAETLTQDVAWTRYFEAGLPLVKSPKLLANWLISELLRELSNAHMAIESAPYTPAHLGKLVSLIERNVISGKIAKDVFAATFAEGLDPEAYVKEHGLVQVTDTAAIEAFVDAVIAENPAQVQQYKEGKTAVLQYLVGQVMKRSKGKANPAGVNGLLTEKLK